MSVICLMCVLISVICLMLLFGILSDPYVCLPVSNMSDVCFASLQHSFLIYVLICVSQSLSDIRSPCLPFLKVCKVSSGMCCLMWFPHT